MQYCFVKNSINVSLSAWKTGDNCAAAAGGAGPGAWECWDSAEFHLGSHRTLVIWRTPRITLSLELSLYPILYISFIRVPQFCHQYYFGMMSQLSQLQNSPLAPRCCWQGPVLARLGQMMLGWKFKIVIWLRRGEEWGVRRGTSGSMFCADRSK